MKAMKNYTPPELPTLEEARGNPDLLKRLPRRWNIGGRFSGKAGFFACAGMIWLATLTGCASGA